ncbi:hypothetical protein QFC19_001760 [Naganishia cerealis]|uniref:Uncharacterized protein n=1 Tax=Naganishia cerealis TaxID=610337 RepID=A0ACC2WFV2_9TREE|nr:hypothetical protein QFC19_001760 [Naganishia cerealis]
MRTLAAELRLWEDGEIQAIDGAEDDERSRPRASIKAVFAIPVVRRKTVKLNQMLKKRNGVLERLEVAESRFIRSFKANLPKPTAAVEEQNEKESDVSLSPNANGSLPRNLNVHWNHSRKNSQATNNLNEAKADTAVTTPSGYVAPRKFYKISSLPRLPAGGMFGNATDTGSSNTGQQRDQRRKATFAEEVVGGISGTQFQEVYRDSLMPGGGLPPVGTPLDVKGGQFVIQPHKYAEKSLPPPPTESLLNKESRGTVSQLASSPRSRVTDNTMRSSASSNYSTALYTSPTRQQPIDNRKSSVYPQSPDHSAAVVNQPLLGDAKTDPPSRAKARSAIQPPIRPVSGISPRDLSSIYSEISEYRSLLKELNEEVVELQASTYEDMMIGKDVVGFFLIGRSISKLPGAILVSGMARDDVDWAQFRETTRNNEVAFWSICSGLTILACVSVIPFVGIANSTVPGLSHYLHFLQPIARSDGPGSGIIQSVIPSIGIALIMWALERGINWTGRRTRSISKTSTEYRIAKATCFFFAIIAVWLAVASGIIFAVEAFDHNTQISRYIADGLIHSSWWLFCFLLNLSVATPALILLRAGLAYRHICMYKKVETPRQRFKAFFPSRIAYQGILATCVFATALSFPMLPIFPLIGLPAVLFLILLFIASQHLTTFTDCNLYGSSGGKLAIYLVRTLVMVLLCQPVLLGLILLSRRELGIGGASLGVALFGLILFESLTWGKGGPVALSRTEHAKFRLFAKRLQSHAVEPIDNMSIDRPNLLLPSDQRRSQGQLPLKTDNIDSYLDPYRANLAHPDINQNQHELPPLSLRDNENLDMAKYQAENTMYPPELIMPAPVIWLPDDKADVGQQEVEDLRRFHKLSAMLDAVRS